MSNSWRTKADVLKDLGTVNGRRTGVEHLDQHVVQGERPPPIRQETPDEDELHYFSGGQACSAAGDTKGPDLAGISVMLKMVNMHEAVDHDEPLTLYHNRAADEIRISKLNPCAGEYVPGREFNVDNGHIKTKENVPQYLNTPKKINSTRMFKTRNNKNINGRNVSTNVGTSNLANKSPDTTDDKVVPNDYPQSKPSLLPNGFPKRTIDKSGATYMFSPSKATNNVNEIKEIEEKVIEEISPSKVTNKANEIKEIQEKIKSTIIASSNDNSLQSKRQKNVAIATLLKMGMGTIPQVADDTSMKLIKPEYYKNPPTELNVENETPVNGTVKEDVVPRTASCEMDHNYEDPDSISKVTGWFNSMESPKPKSPLHKPLVLKESVTFKKKDTSSVSSRTSETSKDKKEPTTEPRAANTPFIPSSYADELLKKYESNVNRVMSSREDLGTMLERQLKARDEAIKQKKLATQNAE